MSLEVNIEVVPVVPFVIKTIGIERVIIEPNRNSITIGYNCYDEAGNFVKMDEVLINEQAYLDFMSFSENQDLYTMVRASSYELLKQKLWLV
jgi:hypothetical protein